MYAHLLNIFLGHENASILHRDVSLGNVMLVDKVDGLRGYLQDFDDSVFFRQDDSGCTLQKRARSVNEELKDITVRIPVSINRHFPN
jgi:hypothetical protein